MAYSSTCSTPSPLIAFQAIENHLGEEEYGYVLRSLYKMVLDAERRRESAKQLTRHIKKFEKDCALPPLFSLLPLPDFLSRLEQMQYFYPLYPREVTFSRFGTAPDDRRKPLC